MTGLTERWRILPAGDSPGARRVSLRLNSLGDPYFFARAVLGMDRMVAHLHGKWLKRAAEPGLHLVLESPRDHLKTSCGAVVLPMWWSLPFEAAEEDWMRKLGYGDAWIRYMRSVHSRNNRTLIASQVEENVVKIGVRIDAQYTANRTFREAFRDLLPSAGSTWNQLSMTQKRTSASGEGTYDLIAVGSALQSRHYDAAVSDDLFGEKALYSPSVAEQTVEWFQRLPGAFDTDLLQPNGRNRELVIGNRWGIHDLNAWIRENDSSFDFETHSALGGCCGRHPAGAPIFPEEFSRERLDMLRARFGVRSFAAHYLNQPMTEEEASFRISWLRRFSLARVEAGVDSEGNDRRKTVIEHLARLGEVEEDLAVSDLKRLLILDPNHGGEQGRARHAAIVIGVKRVPNGMKRIYLLESWAKAVSHEAMASEVARMAGRWRVQEFYVETIAGQDGWLRFFERDLYERLPETAVRALPKERGAGAKERRILAMSPIYERGQFWVRTGGGGVEEFLLEYQTHPQSRTVDLIDAAGYIFNIVEAGEVDTSRWAYLAGRAMNERRRSLGKAGY